MSLKLGGVMIREYQLINTGDLHGLAGIRERHGGHASIRHDVGILGGIAEIHRVMAAAAINRVIAG